MKSKYTGRLTTAHTKKGYTTMTVLQKEIKELGNAINNLGYMWFNGFCDNTTEDEKPLQDAMALLIRINDDRREQQEIAFQQMPWLRKHAGQ